jgi:hypothetical protein
MSDKLHLPPRVGLVVLVMALGATLNVLGQEERSERGSKDSASPPFTAQDIRRSYGFTCTGTASGVAVAQLGQVSCDGIDTCTATGFVNLDGVAGVSTLVGKYTVDNNGLGFITYDVSVGGAVVGQLPIEFVLIRGGKEIRGLPLLPGYSVLCELKEQ